MFLRFLQSTKTQSKTVNSTGSEHKIFIELVTTTIQKKNSPPKSNRFPYEYKKDYNIFLFSLKLRG